jgi:hypothetical protein
MDAFASAFLANLANFIATLVFNEKINCGLYIRKQARQHKLVSKSL